MTKKEIHSLTLQKSNFTNKEFPQKELDNKGIYQNRIFTKREFHGKGTLRNRKETLLEKLTKQTTLTPVAEMADPWILDPEEFCYRFAETEGFWQGNSKI